jgi:hypothetical protein
VALWVVRAAFWTPLPVVGHPPRDGLVRLAGVSHVHTSLSDGGGSPEEVLRAARSAGLSFVVITDHNILDAKPFEGYHDGVLALVGSEISTGAGHILGLGIPDPVFRFSGDALDTLEDVRHLGGFSIAAHPSSSRSDVRWSGWDLPGSWGIEVINGDSQWRRAGLGRLLRAASLYAVNPTYALLGSLSPPVATLTRWDALLQERDVPGALGADAHGRIPLWGQTHVPFPSYESQFRLLRSHVLLEEPLTGEASSDGAAILEALRRGRSYLALDGLAPADAFFFHAGLEEQRWEMGETAPPDSGLWFWAGGRVPAGARLVLRRDGRVVAEGEGSLEAPSGGPGVYRVEVYVPGWTVPWILTNPIYVFDAAERARRQQRGAWPAEPPPADPAVSVEPFEVSTSFAPEFDPTSSMSSEVLAPGQGVDGGDAAVFEFRLGAPTPEQPHTWCALVDRQPRDLSGSQGLVFSIKADGVYRLWVQVRDENPSSEEETEWWFASVRTSPEWRRVSLPFDRLRSLDEKTDGRLDLDRVRGLVFLLDRGAVRPGTTGKVWLDDLGAY